MPLSCVCRSHDSDRFLSFVYLGISRAITGISLDPNQFDFCFPDLLQWTVRELLIMITYNG